MKTQSTDTAGLAASLSDDEEIATEVAHEISRGSLTTLLLQARLAKEMTQEQVAEGMGCNSSKISRLESGNDENLKWMDIVRYSRSVGLGFTFSLHDESLPAATRIKQCVFQISDCLEELTELARQVGSDDEIAKKIHVFSGEVLMDFLRRYSSHATDLQTVMKVTPRRDPQSANEGTQSLEEEECTAAGT